MRERAKRAGVGDPTAFAVDEPVNIELGLELLNKNPSFKDE